MAAKDTKGTRQTQAARKPTKPKRRSRTTARRAPAARAALPPDLVTHFGKETVDLVRAEIPDDATDADLARLLSEARRLQADPLRRDVFLKLNLARDGAEREYSVVARLDALLAYAERQDGYKGHDENAIHADDDFQHGSVDGGAATLRERAGILHLAGKPGRRGELVGAWCSVEVAGRAITTRVIEADEFIGTAEEREQLDPEDPRRRHPDLCAIAAAMSNALRRAFRLNDVVGAEELGAPRQGQGPALAVAQPDDVVDPLGAPVDDLDRAVLEAFHQAAKHAPGRWTAAKVRARLLGDRSDDDRLALADAIRADVLRPLEARRAELQAFDISTLDEDDRAKHEVELQHVTDAIVEALDAFGMTPGHPAAA